MKTELEIAYGRAKVRYQETKEFLNKLKDLVNKPDQIPRQDLKDLIIDFERKIQP